jgi:large subunit ribosomal protein L24e
MKCAFCNKEIAKGAGLLLSRRDGTLVYLCGSKCSKNMFKLGRKKGKVKWTRG